MAEETLYDSEAMRRFAGIELGDDRIPDETTILNFRHLLERHGLTEAIFADVNAHLAYSVENSPLIEGLSADQFPHWVGGLAMMGPRQEAQPALFYGVSLEDYVPQAPCCAPLTGSRGPVRHPQLPCRFLQPYRAAVGRP